MLRIWQYLANSSLWIDEAALARNIIERTPLALLDSLDYAQVAPPGFLLAEKAASSMLGTSEYALRAFPLACGLCALWLFWRVAERLLTGWAVPFAVGLFSIGIPFIYFSSMLKQYSSDVAAALLLLLAALDIRRRDVTPHRAWSLGVAGVVIAFFSQSALFVLAGLGAGFLILVMMERDIASARSLLITWTLWALGAAALTIHALWSVTDLDREYFRWFWTDGFMPMPPQSASDLTWLPSKLTWVFGAFAPGLGWTNGGLNYRWSAVFVAVMLWGFWALWRTRRDAALFLLLPLVVVVCLSALSLYPFTARLAAFLIPFLLLATAAGASHLVANWPRRLAFLTPAVLAVLGGAPIYAAATALPPTWVQHVRPVIAHLSERRNPNDSIYVYYGANLAFRYYAPRFAIAPERVVFGRCALGDPRAYLRDLDQFRGLERIWLIVTHTDRVGELELILGYLDAIGRRLGMITVPGSRDRRIEDASGYLYDLSDRDRLRATSAVTYPLALSPLTDRMIRWGCYGITGGEPIP